MLIVCPACASEYKIDASMLGSEGRRVRCHACSSAWFVMPQEEPPPVEAEPVEEPVDPLGGLSAAEFVEKEWQKAAEEGAVDPLHAIEPEAFAPPPEAQPLEADEPPPPPPPRKAPSQKPLNVKPRGPSGGAAVLAVCGALALVIAVWQRNVTVRWAPSLAGPLEKIGLHVNTRGLVFEDVSSELVVDPSGRFLVVQSTILNVTNRPVVLPPVEAQVRDAGGHTIYTWATEPSRPVLPPGEALPFRTRLAAPPQAGRDVMLRFSRGSAEVASAKH